MRVFISSTFRDMHAERDHLVKVVFPALRERLEDHRVYLIDIDLRWGVTREQAENEQVIDLCLQQARACEIFVGILGQRYGWVPTVHLPELLRDHPWVTDYRNRSVTELEILHGVLNGGPNRKPALFYFRDPAASDAIPEPIRSEVFLETGADSTGKLGDLKERIRASGLPLMDAYPARWDPQAYDRPSNAHGRLAGLDAFGERLGQDLWKAIQGLLELPDRPRAAVETDPLAEEADYHERFMESRLRVYVGREQVNRDLFTFAEGDEAVACLVTGPSGSGKSAALARFVTEYRREHPQTLVVPHFVGASPRSTNLRDMLRRFCQILKTRLGLPEGVPEETAKLAITFREFLGKVPTAGRMLFAIDALDQLDKADRAQDLFWLPAELPPHVKVVASCIRDPSTPGPILEGFRGRMYHELPVEPLCDAERREVIRQVPSLSAKTLDGGQIRMLLDNRATANPLFLLVALEELRGFGSYERLNQRIATFPREGDTITDIFIQVIERLEQEFDRHLVRTVLMLLGCARRGLSERELQGLLAADDGPDVPATDLFPALRQLRPYLLRRGELMDFYHRHLHRAVRQRYLNTAAEQRPVHARLARYFHAQPLWLAGGWFAPERRPNVHKVDELPWQLAQGGLIRREEPDDPGLENVLCELEFIEAKCAAGLVYDLQGDYEAAIAILPEAQAEEERERARLEKVARYTERLIAWANPGSEPCLAGPANPDGEVSSTAAVPQMESEPLWSDQDIEADRQRILHSPTRLDRLRAFAAFVKAESHLLTPFCELPGLCVQQAYNAAAAGPVAEAAARVIQSNPGLPLLLRLDNLRPAYCAHPALQRILTGHGSEIVGLDVAPDGKRAVSAGREDGRLRVWDLETGRCLHTLTHSTSSSTNEIRSSVASLDCRFAVTAGADKRLCLWDLNSGQRLRTIEGHDGAVTSVGSAGGGTIAVSAGAWHRGAGTELRVWDLKTRQCLHSILAHGEPLQSASVTPEGRLAVSAAHYGMHVWDLATGEQLRVLDRDRDYTSVQITADGRQVLAAIEDHTIRVWDLDRGECLRTLAGHATAVRLIRLAPDGRTVVSVAEDRELRVWDLATGECRQILKAFGQPVRDLSWADRGQTVLAISGANLCLVDLASGKCRCLAENHARGPGCLSVLAGGKEALVGCQDGTLEVWDLAAPACRTPFSGHAGPVRAVAALPDGRTALSGGEDMTVRVWDIGSGQCLATLQGETEEIRSLSVTADARLAVTGSEGGTLRVWDLESGECRQTISAHPESAWIVSVTGDGGRAASSDGKRLRLWDLADGECLGGSPHESGAVHGARLTPDGRFLVFGIGNRLYSWDLSTGENRHTPVGSEPFHVLAVTADARIALLRSGERNHRTLLVFDLTAGRCLRVLHGHTDSIWCAAVTPDGRLALSAGREKTIRVWDLVRGQSTVPEGGEAEPVHHVELAPDGNAVVTAHQGGCLKVWAARTGQCGHVLHGHREAIRTVQIASDGRTVVSLGQKDHTFRVWDLVTGECRGILEQHGQEIKEAAIAADGRYAVLSWFCSLLVWDLATGRCRGLLQGHDRQVNRVRILPDNRTVVSADRGCTVRVWDLLTGQCRASVPLPAYHIQNLEPTRDGRALLVRKQAFVVRVCDVATGNCRLDLEGHTEPIHAVALTADGRTVVSASEDRTLRVWALDRGTCRHVLCGHTRAVRTVAVAGRCHRVVSGSLDGTVRVWDLETGECLRVLRSPAAGVWAVAVSGDGQVILSNDDDLVLRVWDLATGQCVLALQDNGRRFQSMSLAQDGRTAVMATLNHDVQIWDLNTRRCRRTLRGVGDVCATQDGRTVLALRRDGLFCTWDGADGQCLQTLARPNSREPLQHGFSLAVAAEAAMAVVTSGGQVRVWDLETGRCLRTFEEPGEVACASPDGRTVATAGLADQLGVLEVATGRWVHCQPVASRGSQDISSVVMSRDGRSAIMTGWDYSLKVWDLRSGALTLRTSPYPDVRGGYNLAGHGWHMERRPRLTPDGKLAVVAGGFFQARGDSEDRAVRVWDLSTGRCLAQFDPAGEVTGMSAISPEGRFAFGTAAGQVEFLQLSGYLAGPPVVTATRIGQPFGSAARALTAACAHCGQPFGVPAPVLETISRITERHLPSPAQSPCLSLPDGAWDEPGLLGECPHCRRPVRFNPFLAGDQPDAGCRSAGPNQDCAMEEGLDLDGLVAFLRRQRQNGAAPLGPALEAEGLLMEAAILARTRHRPREAVLPALQAHTLGRRHRLPDLTEWVNALLESLGEQLALLASTLHEKNELTGALELYQLLEAIYQAREDKRRLCGCCLDRARILMLREDGQAQALEVFERAEQLARELKDNDRLARALYGRAGILTVARGLPAEALPLLEEAAGLALRDGFSQLADAIALLFAKVQTRLRSGIPAAASGSVAQAEDRPTSRPVRPVVPAPEDEAVSLPASRAALRAMRALALPIVLVAAGAASCLLGGWWLLPGVSAFGVGLWLGSLSTPFRKGKK